MGGIGTSLHVQPRKARKPVPPVDREAFWRDINETVEKILSTICSRRERGRRWISSAQDFVHKEYLFTEGVRDRLVELGVRESTDEQLYFGFYEQGEVYADLCLHWYEVAFAAGAKRLDTVARRHGFQIDTGRHRLDALLVRGLASPFRDGFAQYFAIERRRRGERIDAPLALTPMTPTQRMRQEMMTSYNIVTQERAAAWFAKNMAKHDAGRRFEISALTGACGCEACNNLRPQALGFTIEASQLDPLRRAWRLLSSDAGERRARAAGEALVEQPPERWTERKPPEAVAALHGWLAERGAEVELLLLPGFVLTFLGTWWDEPE
jgi:hypothetical protein